jgi:hypothetical protein
LVNQSLQGFFHLLKLIYEIKEEQETGGEQTESETEKPREFPATRFILSVFKSLANAGPLIVA